MINRYASAPPQQTPVKNRFTSSPNVQFVLRKLTNRNLLTSYWLKLMRKLNKQYLWNQTTKLEPTLVNSQIPVFHICRSMNCNNKHKKSEPQIKINTKRFHPNNNNKLSSSQVNFRRHQSSTKDERQIFPKVKYFCQLFSLFSIWIKKKLAKSVKNYTKKFEVHCALRQVNKTISANKISMLTHGGLATATQSFRQKYKNNHGVHRSPPKANSNLCLPMVV